MTTPDGKIFEYEAGDDDSYRNAEARQSEYEAAARAALSERVGREVTDREWLNQRLEASDDRNYMEAVEDDSWQPVLRDREPSQLERLLASTEAEAERKRDPYKNMTQEEAIAYDLKNMIDRESKQELAQQHKANHLKSVAPKLEVLDKLISNESWNPESDERFRVLLSKARRQVAEPDHCPAEAQRLLQQVDTVLEARQTNRQASLLQQREALEAALEANSEQLDTLADPESAE
ncbi:hypothetical protein [Aeoliella mucimassa]|nr:hypothetical protein [Aeoliella mucimassa]